MAAFCIIEPATETSWPLHSRRKLRCWRATKGDGRDWSRMTGRQPTTTRARARGPATRIGPSPAPPAGDRRAPAEPRRRHAPAGRRPSEPDDLARAVALQGLARVDDAPALA